MRLFRKKYWFWAVPVIVAVGLLAFVPPVQVEYHKGRLHTLKQRRARLMNEGLTGMDKFWSEVTGKPVSAVALGRKIQKHEDALVKLHFLDRESLPARMVAERPEMLETLTGLQKECPWFHAETIAATNLLVTACPRMMEGWRKRAKELGW